MEEILIPIIDSQGNIIDHLEKMEVHQKGLLHLAFSVLIYNCKGEMLLQKRAPTKYHSPNLWTNACCGHPYPNESLAHAASRRLEEEMGFTCLLTHQFTFHYKAQVPNNLIENEMDHVFIGEYNDKIELNPEEADAYQWVNMDTLREEVKKSPENFTIWFQEILKYI